jgi:hypothetical protein
MSAFLGAERMKRRSPDDRGYLSFGRYNVMEYNEIVPLCEDSRETEPRPARYIYRRSGLAMTGLYE